MSDYSITHIEVLRSAGLEDIFVDCAFIKLVSCVLKGVCIITKFSQLEFDRNYK